MNYFKKKDRLCIQLEARDLENIQNQPWAEIPINQALNRFNSISRTQLLPLGYVVYTHSPPIATPEIVAHLLITIANNKDKLSNTSLISFNEQMLQNRLIG